jgi:hypothetical protein
MATERASLSDLRIDDQSPYGGQGRIGVWIVVLVAGGVRPRVEEDQTRCGAD